MRPTQSIIATMALLVLLSPLTTEAQERGTDNAAIAAPTETREVSVRAEEPVEKRAFSLFNRVEKPKAAIDASRQSAQIEGVEGVRTEVSVTAEEKRAILLRMQNAAEEKAEETKARTEPVPVRAIPEIKRVNAVETRTSEVRGPTPVIRRENKTDDAAAETDRVEKLRKEQSEREKLQNERRIEQEKKRAEQEEKRLEQEKERAEKREQLQEERRTAIKAYFEKMFRRLDAALDRLTILADRVESRAEKLAERGVDVSEAREKLGEARDAIVKARTILKTLREEVPTLAEEGSTARELFGELKKRIQEEAVEAIQMAHKALIEAISALKADDRVETEEE
ncbi:MAG: hypothetical protein HY455_00755 [Parcubacteria group bacterium]|nr:hypothetical protein [Parcubacteria group bacterium]